MEDEHLNTIGESPEEEKHVSLPECYGQEVPLPDSTFNHDEAEFPEGGRRAWTATFGAFCACFVAYQMTNSIGTFQNWVTTHQLQGYSWSEIGWIFGMSSFINLFCGLVVGPVCDVIGTRIPLWTGAALSVLYWGVLGECRLYWHYMIAIGLLNGITTSLIWVPTVVTVGQYFSRRRGLAVGIAYSGGSTSGIIIPIMLQQLLPRIGFAWTMRAVGLMTLVLISIACLLLRPRLPPSGAALDLHSILPNFSTYRNATFCATSIAIFFLNTGMFIPLGYLPSYAVAQGMSQTTAFHTLTFLNAGSCIGRWVPAYASDKIGRFNTMLLTVSVCVLSTLAIWLPAGSTVPGLVVYTVIFGFASGSNLSLAPVCVGQLCKVSDFARYFTTSTFLASFGALFGNPLAGELVRAADNQFWGVIVYTGLSYLVAFACLYFARVHSVGFALHRRF